MANWIKFYETQIPMGRKTRRWWVNPLTGGILGEIKWFGRWRCYSFFPSAGSVFEPRCLRDIADFCEAETAAHRKGKE